jgi:hypothetical protein
MVKTIDGSELGNYHPRELIEIINFNNSMNNLKYHVNLDTDAKRLTNLLLLRKPEEIIIPDFSVKDSGHADKTFQLSNDQDFTINGTGKRLNQAKANNFKYYEDALNLTNLRINDLKHIEEIEDEIRRSRDFTGRERKTQFPYLQQEYIPLPRGRSNPISNQ